MTCCYKCRNEGDGTFDDISCLFGDCECHAKKEAKGGNLINSPCCNDEIIIHYSNSNFAFIDHFSCKNCKKDLDLKPLEVRKNW